MRIERIVLRQIAMPLKTPFVTSQSTETMRQLLIVQAVCGDAVGYGEVSALSTPFYTEETHQTARLVLETFLIPIALTTEWETPQELAAALARVHRHHMAKAGLEAAAWDMFSKEHGLSVAQAIGGTRTHVESGVVVGIERNIEKLMHTVEQRVQEGYRRVKLKIVPGWDYEPLQAVRTAFPDLALAADANGAYTRRETEQLKLLDELGLVMLEQPFDPTDLVDHARLQATLTTPICLDESIENRHDAYQAIELGSCRIINIKPARVGGITEAIAIHDLALASGVPVWCGGMLESGIGRAHCLAVASLPGFTMPADLSGSDRYWHKDIVAPPVVAEEGFIQVPGGIGLGHEVREDLLEHYSVWSRSYE